jgi:aspartate-semialdehyde dehydrogenase
MFMGKNYRVAILGATGTVGAMIMQILEERAFPVSALKLLDLHHGVGEVLTFKDKPIMVEELTHDAFNDVDIVFSSAGSSTSSEFTPTAVKKGCIVVDNTRAFRTDASTPLVIPEVNLHAAMRHHGVIANPTSATIQMLVALKSLHVAAGLKRIVVSTYQSVSEKGSEAIIELVDQTTAALEGRPIVRDLFPHQIAFNVAFDWPMLDSGDSEEEIEMIKGTQKVLENDNIGVSATTVRVPVFYAHSLSINIETETKLSAKEARQILSQSPGVVVIDDPKSWKYPMAVDVAGRDEVFVGRIREDRSIENGLNLWTASDNLRKGAALNIVQIAEALVRSYV